MKINHIIILIFLIFYSNFVISEENVKSNNLNKEIDDLINEDQLRDDICDIEPILDGDTKKDILKDVIRHNNYIILEKLKRKQSIDIFLKERSKFKY